MNREIKEAMSMKLRFCHIKAILIAIHISKMLVAFLLPYKSVITFVTSADNTNIREQIDNLAVVFNKKTKTNSTIDKTTILTPL